MGFITDVSERMMNQQTLERRVQERTQEIEQRRRVAEGLRGAQAGLFFRFDDERRWAFFEASYGFPRDLAEIESMAVDSSSGMTTAPRRTTLAHSSWSSARWIERNTPVSWLAI